VTRSLRSWRKRTSLGGATCLLSVIAIQAIVSSPMLTPAYTQQFESVKTLGGPIEVLHFERQSYPLYARVRSISGVIILKATVNSTGSVSRVIVLQGPEALREESVKNLKHWRFAQPRPGDVIVVYWFRISGICEPPCQSGYEFYPPNLAVITTGSEVATQ
jgi:Gram-negative bacterial TonB protein C-terminal